MYRFLVLAGIAVTSLMAQDMIGRWAGNAGQGQGRIYLTLRQQSQGLSGTVTYDGAVLLVENASVDKGQLTFQTQDAHHEATFRFTRSGERLTGEMNAGGHPAPLTLTTLRASEPVVVFAIQADGHGRISDIRVLHSLGGGMDEKAIEIVKKSGLKPAAGVEVIVPQGMVR